MTRMKGMRRQRRLAGRFAKVDGISFELPVNSRSSPAVFAGFTCDAKAAKALLPGNEIHPLRVSPRRAVLLITVIDYRWTDIGKYIEFSIAIASTHGSKPAPPLLPGLLPGWFGTGQFVVDLPVSTEISVKGGKGIWGMPKHQANLDYVVSDDMVSSQYDLDGQLAMRIDVSRPKGKGFPLRASAANYCTFRGLLWKSYIHFRGRTHVSLGRKARADMVLGPHPRMDRLRDLDLSSKPIFTAFIPESGGALDDFMEAWMITSTHPPVDEVEGLESVIDLGQSEGWLEPPDRREGTWRP